MNIGWLVLWATLQVGYAPWVSYDPALHIAHDHFYFEPGVSARLFGGAIGVDVATRQYSTFTGDINSWWPDRSEYTFCVHANPWGDAVEVGFRAWCSHQVDPSAVTQWPGDADLREWYVRLKVDP